MKTKPRYYYKIVSVDPQDETLHSYAIHRKNIIEYSTTDWTYPVIPFSRLLVFEKLSQAKSFINYPNLIDCKIFRCLIRGRKRMKELCLDSSFDAAFWLGEPVEVGAPPCGTIGALAVKLVSEVK